MARSDGLTTGILSGALPEKRVIVHSSAGVATLRLGPGRQLTLGAAAIATFGWLAFATAHFAVDLVGSADPETRSAALHDAYGVRLAALTAERDRLAAEAQSAQARFGRAVDEIGTRQEELLRAAEETRELSAALDLMRDRLGRAVAQRDRLAAANAELLADMEATADSLNGADAAGADLADTLAIVTGALEDAVAARDAAETERVALAAELEEVESALEGRLRRQDQMIAALRESVSQAFGPMEEMLEKSGLDPEKMIAEIRPDYSGVGGPLEGTASLSARNVAPGMSTPEVFDELMLDVDRLNLLRIAIGKAPYAMPVRDAYRFTSGFGYRRDPKGGGRRMHSGIDFAAPKGTPIYAAADGVVVSAKNEGGYGQTVRIRHAFGFETVYAHQSRLRVAAGQRVSRGDHIGDMGSTGRSTGVHLHYEVHLYGRPVNPMTYLEAARHVL